MKSKAKKSIEAARILIETRKPCGYNSAVHCSYYAVLQMMKHCLMKASRHGTPYTEQGTPQGASSHEYILREIKQRIDKPQDARRFAETVRSLKRCRVEADYTPRDFTEEESISCKEQAEAIMVKLERYFEV